MDRNFCTLADSGYRAKLLALHASMLKHIGGFHLYILCLDNSLLGLLTSLALENVTLVSMEDFLDPALAARQEDRSRVAWIWTMTPSLPLYLLRRFPDLREIAYADADLLFFSSPEPMFEEIGGADSMVIPHRFPPGREKLENGTYNVSLVWWRRTDKTMEQLQGWRFQCLDWCHEWVAPDGKFADQGYLNDWPEKWGSHVLGHLGCNLAPWNMGQYGYRMLGNEIYVEMDRLIFFHFHEFKVQNEWAHDFHRGDYPRPAFVEKHIYAAYEAALKEQIERIRPYVQSTR